MEILSNLYKTFNSFCSRKKRPRSLSKTENLINLKRKKLNPLQFEKKLNKTRSSVFYSDDFFPATSKDLFYELVSNPTSIKDINLMITKLEAVKKQGDVYIQTYLKRKYTINSAEKKTFYSKNTSKLQQFLNDHQIEEVNDRDIQDL